jgi:hypothetical protein
MFFTRSRYAALTLTALVVLLLAAGTAVADERWHGFVDGPIVIGDQLYQGGEIEIRTHFRFDAVSIRLDGEPVAVMFHNSDGARARDAKPALVLRFDERGYRHLVALRWQDGDETSVQRTRVTWDLRVASAIPGLATIEPPSRAIQPDQAVANR